MVGLFGIPMDCHGQQDQLILIDTGLGIYSFEPSSCQTTLLGTPGFVFGDIALTSDLRLFGISSSLLVEVDMASMSAAIIDTLPPPLGAVSLVGWGSDRLLFESWDSLFVINTDGSGLQSLGFIGFSASGDLTWYEGDLYMTAGFSTLVRIEIDTLAQVVQNVIAVGEMQGNYQDYYGAVTIENGPCGNDLSIIGFDIFDVHLVHPMDASTTMLCEGLLPYSIRGAATSAEVRASVPFAGPRFPNVFTPNGDLSNDRYQTLQEALVGSLTILNRWGQAIYQGPLETGWDGNTTAGEPCSDGVYFYIAQATDPCGQVAEHAGHFSLIR